MITAIAVDDESPALRIIEHFCRQSGLVKLARSFTHPREALDYLEKFPVDLLFLDIRMPSISGIAFAGKVPPGMMVIFTTAYSEFAVDGFNLNAVDYLLKPFTYDRFLQAAGKAVDYYRFIHQMDPEDSACIYVRADYSLVRIKTGDILYVEGLDDYLKIFLPERKPVIARMTLKSMLEKLPQKQFIRVHRSYIVPIQKIDKVRNKVIHIGEKEIPVGSSYETQFYKSYQG